MNYANETQIPKFLDSFFDDFLTLLNGVFSVTYF